RRDLSPPVGLPSFVPFLAVKKGTALPGAIPACFAEKTYSAGRDWSLQAGLQRSGNPADTSRQKKHPGNNHSNRDDFRPEFVR
ncbi:MAG: hypothetical protein L0H29_11110, partial [Sinobacteraceae bacterium]|nr:hypothetical protein [Nevskiaceae bacterium]